MGATNAFLVGLIRILSYLQILSIVVLLLITIWFFCFRGKEFLKGLFTTADAFTDDVESGLWTGTWGKIEAKYGHRMDPTQIAVLKVATARTTHEAVENVQQQMQHEEHEGSWLMRFSEWVAGIVGKRRRREPVRELDDVTMKHV